MPKALSTLHNIPDDILPYALPNYARRWHYQRITVIAEGSGCPNLRCRKALSTPLNQLIRQLLVNAQTLDAARR